MIPTFILNFLGKIARKKLDLTEGLPMDKTKPWYKNITIWKESL